MKKFKIQSEGSELRMSVEVDGDKKVLFINIADDGFEKTYTFKNYWQLKKLKDWLDKLDLVELEFV